MTNAALRDRASITTSRQRSMQLAAWCAALLTCLSPLAIEPAARAQTLDLSGVPAGPALPASCGAEELAKALDSEAATMSAEAAKLSAEARDALTTRAKLRSLAAFLLANGARRPWNEAAPVVAGMRLQGLLRRVDALLEATLQGQTLRERRPLRPEETRRAIELLKELASITNERVRGACGMAPDQLTIRLREALATTLGPLRELAELVEGIEFESPWPIVLDARASSLRAADRAAPLSEVERRAQTLPAGAALDAVRGAIEVLGRSTRSPSHESDLRLLGEAITALEWIDAQRTARSAAVDAESLDFGERAIASRLDALSTGENAMSEASRRSLVECFRVFTGVRAAVAYRETLGQSNSQKQLMTDVVNAMLRGVAGTQGRDFARVADRIASACDAASRIAEGRAAPPPKDLRDQARELDRRAPEVLSGLPKTLASWTAAVSSDATASSDPAAIAAIERVESLARDQERIAILQRIVDTITGIRMKSKGGFASQAKRLGKMLGSTLERASAEATIASIEMQTARCVPLQFEEDLKRKTQRALELSGGRASELADAAGRARLAWAESLALGNFEGPDIVRMDRVIRLFDCLADLDRMESPITRDDGDLLATWGGWASRRAALAPAAQDLTARAKLACQSMLAASVPGADGKTEEQLERDISALERSIPVVRLAAQLEARICPLMPVPRESVAALLAPLVIAPDPDAYLLREVGRLAMINRALLESEFSRRTGDIGYRDALGDFIAALARETSRSAFGAQRAITIRPEADRPEADRNEAAGNEAAGNAPGRPGQREGSQKK